MVPNPASDWSSKDHYADILDGIAALIEKCRDPDSIRKMITRVIQPLIIPLLENTTELKAHFDKEGRKLVKSECNELILNSIFGYLNLIGDFLKGC